jgi:eukaryotic-like serine/threonine-protein kinase
MQDWEKIKLLFRKVVELPPEERDALLNEECKDNPGLKKEVEALIEAAGKAENYWEVPPLDSVNFTEDGNSADYFDGIVIGKYKVEKKIGEGGMAVVYSAVRIDNQFNRRVAIKFIKRGMDTNEIIRRFRVEQQTLAGLDHPYIAKIIDGGTTEERLQYFVMEYIDGIPITNYCDQNKFTLDQRLDLFIKVCSAVNYAHQNLIVHRDLKPNNILITSDGNPKLLDFGIAKLLAKDQSINTFPQTEDGTRFMTVEYASPEQVTGGKITTSSDVYSLGVLLYELLTGHLPYRLKNKFPQEVEKIITSVNPEKPSTIITKSKKVLTDDGNVNESSADEISKLRGSNVEKLKRRLSGDMDNIILMALRKDPERRYISVQHLSEDLKRYSEGRPVTANRDSLFYRSNKFIKRHKIGVTATILFLLLALSSVIIIIYQAGITKKERDKATLEASRKDQINNFLNEMLFSSDPLVAGKNLKLADVLNEASKKITTELKGQPQIEAEVRSTIGQTYENLGMYDDAIYQLGRSLQLMDSLFGENNKETAIGYNYLAMAYDYKGNLDTAKYLYKKSIKLLRQLNDKPKLEEALNDYGTLQLDLYDLNGAKKTFEEALKLSLKVFGKESRETAVDINNLAFVLDDQSDLDSAKLYYNEAIIIDTKLFGDTSVDLANNLNNLAFVYREKGNYNTAESLFISAYNIRKKILGDDHPDVAVNKLNVGSSYYYLKDYSKAEQLINEAINTWKGKVNNDHYYFANAYAWLGKIQNAEGRYKTAYSNLTKSLQIRKKIYDDKNSLIVSTKTEMGRSLLGQNKFSDAEKILLDDYNQIKDIKDFDVEIKKNLLSTLADLYTKWGKINEAKKISVLTSKN